MARDRGYIRPHAVSAAGENFVIWGDTQKLEEFFEGISQAPNTTGPDRVVNMPQMIVKRYPSDTGFTRKAHQRKVAADTGIKRGTTPGRNFTVEEDILDSGTLTVSIRVWQFTATGTTLALRAYARAKAKSNFRLRWYSGRFEEITTAPPVGGGTLQALSAGVVTTSHAVG